jgi:HSP20 family protein
MSLRQAMNRLFEESFLPPKYFEPFRQLVPIDLRETPTEYVVEASLPGIKSKEMQITATDKVNAAYEHGVLTLTVPKTSKSGPAQIPV